MSKDRKFQVGDTITYEYSRDSSSPYKGKVTEIIGSEYIKVHYYSWKGLEGDGGGFDDTEEIDSSRIRKLTPLEKLL